MTLTARLRPSIWSVGGLMLSCWIYTVGSASELASATGIEGFVPCAATTGMYGAYSKKAVFVGAHNGYAVLGGLWVCDGDQKAIEARARLVAASLGRDIVLLLSKSDDRLFLRIAAGPSGFEVERGTMVQDFHRWERAAGWEPDDFEDCLAAPEPTLSLDDLFVRKDVRVQASIPDRCPTCGSSSLIAITRDALPWEPFETSTNIACNSCGAKVEVQVGTVTRPEPEPRTAPKPEPEPGRGYRREWEDWGYKSSWLAIAMPEPGLIMKALGLSGWRRCTWKAGVRGALDGLAVFVSEPVDDVVFVLGDTVDEGGRAEREQRVVQLSEALEHEVFLFVSQRVLGEYQIFFAYDGEPVETPVSDEAELLAVARTQTLDPRTFSARPEEAVMGWAVPEPLPPGMRLQPTRPVMQAPAASRDEAILHARTRQGCPSCGSEHIATYLPGRESLPWEPHVLAIAVHCSECRTRHELCYPAGPTYEHPPAPSELRISTSDAPSALIPTEDWLRIVEEQRESQGDAREVARTMTWAAHELAKVGEHPLSRGEIADYRARALR